MGVVKRIPDDPMTVRMEASHERDVIGEGHGREYRNERGRADTIPGNSAEVLRFVAIEIIGADAIERD
jgi:hypothetical protein